MGNRKCAYKITYIDENGKETLYECPYDAIQDGYCIFHHPEYWRENPDEVRETFYKELKKKVKKRWIKRKAKRRNRVIFVGYNLPSINIKGLGIKKFDYVCFSKCKFHGETIFSGIKFDAANFDQVEFNHLVDLSEAKFKKIIFYKTTFWRCLFDNAKFYGKTTFNLIQFEDFISFNDTKFLKEVYFSSNEKYTITVFNGIAKFNKTIFGRDNITKNFKV